jgi:hypothetical protein
MASGGMTYIPSIMTISSGIQVILDITAGGMMYTPSFMTISWGIQVTLGLLPQQSERLQCWYYWGIYEACHWYGQTWHDIQSFMTNGTGLLQN